MSTMFLAREDVAARWDKGGEWMYHAEHNGEWHSFPRTGAGKSSRSSSSSRRRADMTLGELSRHVDRDNTAAA